MLNFTTSLTNALTKSATISYWLLRLYYNDGTKYTGISDKTRTIGGVIYYGLATWGNHNQTLRIDQFTTSNGTMQIKLDNSPNKIDGKRFSDLLTTNNYANRKWELFQCDENADFSTDNMIAGGIISSDFKHTGSNVTIYLNDYWAKYNIEIPITRATANSFPFVPEKNIDEPISIFCGDLLETPTESWHQNPEFAQVKVPALIVDGWEDDNAGVTIAIDSETINDFKDLFLYNSGQWMYLDATPSENLPQVSFIGSTWKTYYSLSSHDDEDAYSDGSGTLTGYTNAFDKIVTSKADWNFTSRAAELSFRLNDKAYNKLGGTISKVNIKLHCEITEDATEDTVVLIGVTFNDAAQDTEPISIADGENMFDITGLFSADQLESWNLDLEEIVIIWTNAVKQDIVELDIYEIGIEFEFAPEKLYAKIVTDLDKWDMIGGEVRGTGNIMGQWRAGAAQIGEIESVYVSGKGREYDTWINSRDLPYSSGNVIKNPVFMIENIARTEMGTTAIKTSAFNTSGEEDGDLENAFGEDSVEDILFAFDIYRLIFSKRLIEKIASQCGSYVWWSADELSIKTRRRTYTSADLTIDFKDIKIIDFGLTPMDDVFNYITVDYLYDYGTNKTIKSRTPDDNGNLEDEGANSSQSSDVGGYGDILKLIVNMPFTLDQTTADNYGEALLAWYKDRKQIITIDTKIGTAKYNKAEVGDTVNFKNWDSNLKVFGDTISTSDGFMITQIIKRPNGTRLQVTEVAGTIS